MSRRQQKKRRDKLYDMFPYCFWCNAKLIRDPGQPNSLTLDHVYSKLNPKRYHPSYENITVISCYYCNQERGRSDEIRFKIVQKQKSLTFNDP